jgi:type IV secretion system protein VirB5
MPPEPTTITETPTRTFLTARAEFSSVFGDLAKGKRNWQVVAITALALLGLVLTAYIRLAATSRITPYVVEVDKLGRAVAFGPAEQITPLDRRIVIAQLASFITTMRTVVPSPPAQRDLIERAYAFVDAHGAAFLNSYFSDPGNDPRVLGATMTRLVDVTSILPVPGTSPANPNDSASGTWKVQWIETAFPTLNGGVIQHAAWEGYFTLHRIPPTRADVIEINPLGLYISAISWSRIAAPVEDSTSITPTSATSSLYPATTNMSSPPATP